MRKRNLDLTKGSILSQIFIFALPFLGSSLIQQLYGTVDIIFAGQLLGKEAAAAIGASTFIAYVIVGFFIGISVGVSVITAKLYGAGKMDSLRELFTSALSFALALSTVLVIISIAIAQQLLTLLNTPDTIMRIEVLYIRIYLLSLPSIIFYNIVSGIIRAMGDSRSPMMYRLYGGIANVAGNTLFVYFLRLGVARADA